jgi:ATP-binding cassette subfamily B protein
MTTEESKPENTKPPLNVSGYLLAQVKPYSVRAVIFVMLAMGAGICVILQPNLSKVIIDRLVNLHESSDMTFSIFLPAILFIANLELHNACWRGIDYINYKTQPLIKASVFNNAMSYVMQHSPYYFQRNLAGKITGNILTLANNVEKLLHNFSRHIIKCSAMVLLAFANLYFVHQLFFMIFIAWALIFICLSIFTSRRVGRLSSACAREEANVAGQVVDRVNNAFTIRIFNGRFRELQTLRPYLLRMSRAIRNKEMFVMVMHFLQGLSLSIMCGLMLYGLIRLRAQGLVTIGDFALILGLSVEIGYNLWMLTEQIDSASESVGKCSQSLKVIFSHLEIKDRAHADVLQVAHGKILFKDVTFQYKGTDPIFQDKSVLIKGGQKVGLVGYSGSGKTTFAHLILRLYELDEGSILIDGQNIRDVTQYSLYDNIMMIPQSPSLFQRTLMENIRYGRANATDEEVIAAAKSAHVHDFITSLPQAYNTVVAAGGATLSGGQRQRIAIARAVLKNAPILILDEATSQLDSMTEREIQESIAVLMKGKTTIVIAHRLSTLLNMDRILVFDSGNIIEDGTHSALLKKGGLYTTLWNTQVGGVLLDKEDDDDVTEESEV